MDRGVPSLQTSRNMTIRVSDVNEFRPTFSSSEYSAIALDTAPVGTSLLQVLAIDGDAEDNTVSYSILSQDNTTIEFSVDANGVIRNEEPFPRATRSNVSPNGLPVL